MNFSCWAYILSMCIHTQAITGSWNIRANWLLIINHRSESETTQNVFQRQIFHFNKFKHLIQVSTVRNFDSWNSWVERKNVHWVTTTIIFQLNNSVTQLVKANKFSIFFRSEFDRLFYDDLNATVKSTIDDFCWCVFVFCSVFVSVSLFQRRLKNVKSADDREWLPSVWKINWKLTWNSRNQVNQDEVPSVQLNHLLIRMDDWRCLPSVWKVNWKSIWISMKISTRNDQDEIQSVQFNHPSIRMDAFVKRKGMFAIVWLKIVLVAISRAKAARAQNVGQIAVKIAMIIPNASALKDGNQKLMFTIHIFSYETQKWRT